jgi:hypothetical protein
MATLISTHSGFSGSRRATWHEPNALFEGRRGAHLFALALVVTERSIFDLRQMLRFRREFKRAARPVRSRPKS